MSVYLIRDINSDYLAKIVLGEPMVKLIFPL